MSSLIESVEQVFPGVWRVRLGDPEKFTPVGLREIAPDVVHAGALPAVPDCPIDLNQLRFKLTPRGCVVEIPMGNGEQIYGMGLQLKSLNQTAKKRTVRVNSDPLADTGDSHAPVPFYASTSGYGVLIDTARYALVNLGSHVKVGQGTPAVGGAVPSGSTSELYKARALQGRFVVVDIPTARGVDLYFFAGPTVRNAVQRYNLFSGGGCLPAIWGLGIWYRPFTGHSADKITEIISKFREQKLPVTVIGLEPGWQGQSYSCSFKWSTERFPEPQKFIDHTLSMGYQLNLWEHVFPHPTSPIYEPLKPHSGDYEVWGGLIPDLSLPQARKIFADYHETELVDKGISGFKLDECDNSDITPWFWSFPEATEFPSGMDGEQMHSMLGLLYQRTIDGIYRKHNQRTYSLVRSSHALASPYAYVLYSDLYDHKDFVRGVTTMGFAGLLWTPEVREGVTAEGLIRRVQSVAMSPMALINGWYLATPPWEDAAMEKAMPEAQLHPHTNLLDACRPIFELRMSLVPYLYAAFARYRFEGLPPFRALVMDYPHDANVLKTDDQWMMGDNMLVAPMFAGQTERDVYLPQGKWHDFNTGKVYEGAQSHKIAAGINTIPLFVRDGTILPLAEPLQTIAGDTVFNITPHVYGTGEIEPFTLWEDDGTTFNYEQAQFNRVTLVWNKSTGLTATRQGNYKGIRYNINQNMESR